MRMLVELSAVRMRGAEDTDLHALFAGPPEYGPGGSTEQGIQQEGPVVVEEGPQQVGHSESDMLPVTSGRMWLCCDIHCFVALKPQALQAFDLQLWRQKKRLWVHSGDEQ